MSRAFNKTLNIGQPVNRACSLNDGLVSWWMVHPGTHRGSILFRDLCNRNHGTLTNMAPATDWRGALGRPGGFGCLDFDGSNDYVAIASPHPVSTGPCTIAAWVKTSNSANQGIFTLKHSVNVAYFGLGINGLALYSYISDSGNNVTTASSGTVASGEWAHGVATFVSATERYCYRNGGNSGTTIDNRNPTGLSDAFIGTYAGASSFVNGSLDDVMVWSRALSASEVSALYNDSRRGHPEMLNWIRPTWYLDQAGGGGGGLANLLRGKTRGGLLLGGKL